MKNQILSVILFFVVLTGLSQTTFAATVNRNNYTLLNDIKAFNKIEVRGNVELFISDNTANNVNVYNKYYAESALIQCTNGVLRISSYNTEKLVVWVNAADLRSISAYDNAEVKSFGKLSEIELNVDLHNNAIAKLNIDNYSSSVTLKDHSKVELSGTANVFTVVYSAESTVNHANFTAEHYTNTRISNAAAKSDALAGLE